MRKSEEEFGRQAKALFDESVDGLDAATLSKLNRSRQAAVAEVAAPNRQWLRWMPATGLAAVVLLAVMVARPPAGTGIIDGTISDFEIVMGEEHIDMIEELEFYSWLATQELDVDSDVG